MPAPDLSTRQIALLFKDLVHYICFQCSFTVFTNNFLFISIFYPALRQQGFPKFMRAGDLSKLKISKTFYTHYMRVASFDFGEIQTQKTIFFRSGHLYFYTIQSLRTVYFSVLSNNLSNWCHEELFFAPTFYKKNSIFCRWKKSTRAFIPHLIVSVFSRFGAHSPVDLWQSLTSSGLEGILSNYMYLSVEEEGFPVWTSLLLFTVCQTPSVNFDMSNLGPTIKHT